MTSRNYRRPRYYLKGRNFCGFYPVSPMNVNHYNETIDSTNTYIETIDLTNTEDEINIDKYIVESGELWNPTVKKIKNSKKKNEKIYIYIYMRNKKKTICIR